MLRTPHCVPTLRRKSIAKVDNLPNLARDPEFAIDRVWRCRLRDHLYYYLNINVDASCVCSGHRIVSHIAIENMSGIDRVRYLTLCLIAQTSCRKSACSAFWTTRKIGYIIYHCDGFSTERWDAMQCPEHTFQTSILQYISSSRSSRKWHAGSRSVAHSGPRARSGDSLPALARPIGGLCRRETARLRAAKIRPSVGG